MTDGHSHFGLAIKLANKTLECYERLLRKQAWIGHLDSNTYFIGFILPRSNRFGNDHI
jgi:hypothetical protein